MEENIQGSDKTNAETLPKKLLKAKISTIKIPKEKKWKFIITNTTREKEIGDLTPGSF